MSLLQKASVESSYGLDLAEIARIWRGGCIIRSKLLESIRLAYSTDPSLDNLLLDKTFADMLNSRIGSLRKAVVAFNENGIPADVFLLGPRIFRRVPHRTPARQPDPGPTRLLRCTHISTDRQRRHVPHAGLGEVTSEPQEYRPGKRIVVEGEHLKRHTQIYSHKNFHDELSNA